MRKISLLTLLFLSIQVLMAQPEDKKIGKITFLMVDGKYEDAAFKAMKLKDDSEYRKNAWVYFYLSQSFFEIAGKAELSEKYPKAFKESLKAAAKLTKYKNKPAENIKVWNEAQEYFSILQDSSMRTAQIYYDTENYRKAAYYMAKTVKFVPDDYAVWLMKGIYEIKSRNVGEGVKSILHAMDSLNMSYVPYNVSVETLVEALDAYALIIKSGEYDQYFKAYKFNPTEEDVQEALALKEEFKKYLDGEEENVEERKKESEIIYKTFRSDDTEDEE
ncbi:MAG: hypothetical protein JKY48_20240 [Flavobacteriales bacterium]|nr:hypothetical protein [Flavobacteriales bacterium]